MSRSKSMLTPLLLVLILGLTACVPEASSGIIGGNNGSTTPGSAQHPDNDRRDDSNNSNKSDDSDSLADPADASPQGMSRAECVIGIWQADNAVFESYMNSLVPEPSMRMSITGASLIRFDAAGQFFSWREDFTMTTRAQGQTVTHVSNSAETGDYGLVLDWGSSPSTDFLWVAETMTVIKDEVFNIGGIATVVEDGSGSAVELFNGYQGELPVVDGEPMEGSLPFTCTKNTLTFEFDVGKTMPYHRITTSG